MSHLSPALRAAPPPVSPNCLCQTGLLLLKSLIKKLSISTHLPLHLPTTLSPCKYLFQTNQVGSQIHSKQHSLELFCGLSKANSLSDSVTGPPTCFVLSGMSVFVSVYLPFQLLTYFNSINLLNFRLVSVGSCFAALLAVLPI